MKSIGTRLFHSDNFMNIQNTVISVYDIVISLYKDMESCEVKL